MDDERVTADMASLAAEIRKSLRDNFDEVSTFHMVTAQVLGVGEEAGEFVGAFRRYMGWARRSGSFAEMAEELADVVIMSWVAANYLGVDLTQEIDKKAEKIRTRGWKDPR
jgi:NTP pyrophosphatase (non-canonical NTP hydrolase)